MRKLYFNILLICFNVALAQDPQFTNSSQSLVNLNPSFSGSNGFVRNHFNYRNQWPELSGSYVTYVNSFDIYFDKIKSGFSFSFMHDDQAHGTVKTDALNLAYSRPFIIKEKLRIVPSIQFGYFNKTVDLTKLTFGNQLSSYGFIPQFTGDPTSSSKQNINLSSGLLVNYDHFYLGASVFNINQPDEGLFGSSKLPYRLSVHTSYNLILSEKTLIHFFARYSKQQAFSYYQFDVSCVLFRNLILGAGYKYSSSPFAFIGYRHNLFTLQFDYENYYGSLSGGNLNAYEISASFNLRQKDLRNTLVDFERW